MVMSDSVFLDSSFLIALFVAEDSLHSDSIFISETKVNLFQKCVISSYVLAEVLTVVSQRVGKKRAEFASNKLFSQDFELIHIGSEHLFETAKIFQQAVSKNFGFVDASIIATMKLEGCRHLITFDEQLASVAKKHRLSVYGIELV